MYFLAKLWYNIIVINRIRNYMTDAEVTLLDRLNGEYEGAIHAWKLSNAEDLVMHRLERHGKVRFNPETDCWEVL
jgi:hypothetical protein